MRRALTVTCFAAALALSASAGTATEGGAPAACPDSRAHIEPLLNTVPEDGDLYKLQRQALHMPVTQILELMGGIRRAYAIAAATRENAVRQLESGAEGAGKRFHLDTILRADALVAILDCLAEQKRA
jgi:hypothetical protein